MANYNLRTGCIGDFGVRLMKSRGVGSGEGSVELEYKGRVYSATYSSGHGGVTTSVAIGLSTLVDIGGMTAEWAAREGLKSLIAEADRAGTLFAWPARSVG